VDNVSTFLAGIDELCRTVQVWPPPKQMNTVHSKWTQVQNLLHVALSKTHTMRPQSKLLKDGEPFPPNIVLKRTHSDTGHHVLFPGDPRRNWDYMRLNCEVPGLCWFGQTYVEPLAKIGEWRVFLLGGRDIYTVHTHYNKESKSWRWDIVTTFYTLEELRQADILHLALHVHESFAFSKIVTSTGSAHED
jgi:hypothetical protein